MGVGTLWENSLHPARWRVTLHGYPNFWSDRLSSALLDQLRALRPDPRFLQTSLSVLDEAARSFLQQHGFAPLMRTRRGVLPPDAIAHPVAAELDGATARIEAAGYRVTSLEEMGSGRLPVSVLARLHADLYRQGHPWDPVRPLADDEAVELFLDPDELLADAMFLALAGEKPIAAASLRCGDTPARVDLGWTGALAPVAPLARDVVMALAGRCFHHAAIQGWSVVLEVDESDTCLWQLLDWLPVTFEPDWFTFVERSRQSA